MALITSISIFILWFLLGWAVLSCVSNEDRVVKALLSPTLGFSILTVVATFFSLAGLIISRNIWLFVFFAVFIYVLYRRKFLIDLLKVTPVIIFLVAVNVFLVGMGMLSFGFDWHGSLNQDGATNSMAARYFLQNSFFDSPSIDGALSALDYSSLSSKLFVVRGHRFGDVLLLGISSSIFNIDPDVVYMAHGFALRCSLIASSSLLVWKAGASIWRILVFILLLSLSPFLAYTYQVQLISQLGGIALAIEAALLVGLIFKEPYSSRFNLMLLPIGFTISALCVYYPDSLPLLVLTLAVFIFYSFLVKKSPPLISMIKGGLFILLFILIVLNRAIPNIISHLLGLVGWGLTKSDKLNASDINFDYAFSPDFFTLIFGLASLQEVINEPWALIALLTGVALFFWIIVISYKKARVYPLLTIFFWVSGIIFFALYWQGNGFGTFKMMLVTQPFIVGLLTVGLLQIAAVNFIIFLILLSCIVYSSHRTLKNYTSQDFGPMKSLNNTHIYMNSFPNGVIFFSPNFLTGNFAALRIKKFPAYLDQNILQYFAGPDIALDKPADNISFLKNAYLDSSFSLVPKHDKYKYELNNFYKKYYIESKFNCGPKGLKVDFWHLNRNTTPEDVTYIVPGAQSIPLNRNVLPPVDYLPLNKLKSANLLVFRPSSVGEYYGVSDDVGIFDPEGDPTSSLKFSAVGRYALLEVLHPSTTKINLDVSFTRSYQTAGNWEIPEITFYGKQPVRLKTVGEGSINLITAPIEPCLIEGKSYILVDFGLKPARRLGLAPSPYSYKWIKKEFLPDRRYMVGHLRDISISRPLTEQLSEESISKLSKGWDYSALRDLFEFSGVFEDGWVSNGFYLKLKKTPTLSPNSIDLIFDIPSAAEDKELYLVVHAGSKEVIKIPVQTRLMKLKLGYNQIYDSGVTISLVGNGLVLPVGGRKIFGHINSIGFQKK